MACPALGPLSFLPPIRRQFARPSSPVIRKFDPFPTKVAAMASAETGRSSALTAFLADVPLFAGLDDRALSVLARSSRIRCISAGETLFCEGDHGDAAYVVRTGCVAIKLDTADGRELVINEMRPGDCFGELALVAGVARSATATATQPTEVVVIPRREFNVELEKNPVLARRLLELVARRLARSSEREEALAFLDAPVRLARLLFTLEREQATSGLVTATQEELARRVGIARQSTAEILSQWRRAGWVITGRGRIMLVDRSSLYRCTRQDE